MRITEKQQRRLRNILFSLTIICLAPVIEQGSMQSDARTTSRYICRDITCAIDLGDDMYSPCGLETGLNYELINRFAKDNRCKVKIITTDRKADFLDSLRHGRVDIVVTHITDSTDSDGIRLLHGLDECSAWAVNSTDKEMFAVTNRWIRYMTSSLRHNEVKDKFEGLFNPHKAAAAGKIAEQVSPYDDLLKKHSKALGWDWRLVAAVVYQESRFSINSRSSRGAVGLMQVMPKTGEYYGIDNLEDPEQNIIAGTSHLNRLRQMFLKWRLEPEELVKFTLAAYNAGEGRVIDCRTFAASKGYDNTRWEEVVKVIPMMRDDSILSDENIRHGKFNGEETIRYIDSVMSHYEAICRVCPEK